MAEAEKQKPTAEHIRTDRTAVVDLDYPIKFDGKVWDKVTVRRMTGTELTGFLESNTPNKVMPMFDCPDEVIRELDADDDMKVQEVANRFLPRRLSGETDSGSSSDQASSGSAS